MRRVVSTDRAPKAIGPYSQATVFQELVFCSGQIPIDPATQQLVQGTIQDEVRQVMQNLDAVLRASGSSLGRILRTTIYLTDLNDFATVNEVYASFFSAEPPARSTVQVAALPRGVRVEIDAIAAIG